MNSLRTSVTSICLSLFVAACGSGQSDSPSQTGGSGGSESGGSGGSETGGSGGSESGGSGGSEKGGAAGGTATGGSSGSEKGGAAGGTATGGASGSEKGGAAGGTATGGAGGNPGGTGGGTATGGSTGTVTAPKTDFTETVNGVAFDMVYVPGGTFTLGCESSPCPANTTPVEGVQVSSYHIAKNEVTSALWTAVMGGESSGFGGPSITWYDAMAFACKLSQMTGKNYRMMTEAEFEYAAKNHLSSLEDVGSGEEWAYNSWSATHMGGTDPVGSGSGVHTQKTRRDAQETGDNITGRLIRSIDGIGPQFRPVVSAEMDFPPGYVPPCELHAPTLSGEPENSYRDPRWITGSDAHWSGGGFFDLRVWEDGTARLGSKNGQWFTSNNIAFVFVSSSGALTKLPYIFLDETQGSVISGDGFTSGGFIGRIYKEEADHYDEPAVADLKSGAELAAAAGDEYDMVDMVNIPESAKEQDERLIDGPGQGWSQKNVGSQHHYRKDVDPDEFRFTVNQSGNRVMLANGAWFTVNNTFLRITHSTGYTCDYLYAVTSDGTFYHDSFQGYERADFRVFKKVANGPDFNDLCGEICSDEIPKGEPASMYARMEEGKSTFVPAPCPPDGCK
ncbi:MAG: SUMF1/EgtB/PvdO family nonheme iron enzyme [Deltaproteobacteria bacterium]|nr:SUMF1/EgtB/PvdO family nonheme iron enzyme [Deltaproteobacteria bacterium]